ncbi:thioesterase II family protein [Kitasatospora griseola]|uniref:thioesterase II family protein n=1 Tax=Kitasatospora griseola TaxID=2064 RepID=UPI00198DC42E|nr:thioesterase domain-containing protein [Kitasatospora griseola]GGR05713.1 hypothetical protein GCM10010195_71280 [Kitasatospora griseola]
MRAPPAPGRTDEERRTRQKAAAWTGESDLQNISIGLVPRIAAVNSLGVGGTNACAVVAEAPRRDPAASSFGHVLLPALRRTAQRVRPLGPPAAGDQVYGICPAGRGPRVSEPSLTRLPDLVTALLDETDFEPPFVFFGHSLGALTAFETARALRARGRPLPRRLIVSAHAAPGTQRRRDAWHTLPDEELIRALNDSYDSIPEHVLADPHLMAMSLQAIRADFQLLDGHRHRAEDPLPVPIDAFYGEADTVPLPAVEQWRHHTARAFRTHPFPGGHFHFRHVDIFDVLGTLLHSTAAEDRSP